MGAGVSGSLFQKPSLALAGGPPLPAALPQAGGVSVGAPRVRGGVGAWRVVGGLAPGFLRRFNGNQPSCQLTGEMSL